MQALLNSSSLGTSANNIVTASSKIGTSLVSAKKEYSRFNSYLDSKRKEIEAIPLPDNKKLKKLSNINVVNTFGTAGNLLSGLLGGALDLGGFIRGFFPGEGEKIGSSGGTGGAKEKPKIFGNKLNIGGVRALGIANSVFAGLDFATGLTEGESIGKSAAGASGSLAGSLLGGAIGQALIPIPGVGFVIGSAVGGFLGGYGADRVYDSIANQERLKYKQEVKLIEKSKNQESIKKGRVEKQNEILEKFTKIADDFGGFIYKFFGPLIGAVSSTWGSDEEQEFDLGVEYPNAQQGGGNVTGEYEDIEVTGGFLPSSRTKTSGFGWGWGRMHKGNDYAGAGVDHQPVSVIQPGKVVIAGFLEGGAGNSVIIDHPDGTTTKYFHLADNSIKVRVGENIQPGRVIGVVGSTGRSTGPHLHFEVWRNGKAVNPDDASDPDKYFRFGGNVKVRRKDTPKVSPLVQTGVQPGRVVDTQFGRQGSTQVTNLGPATKTNIKGFYIVPGHIAGGGTEGEIAAVEKIAKNVVAKLQQKYPGVPVKLWNFRNYPQNDPGFIIQMNDLKRLEAEGWEIIEIHMDASIESGKGTGRGVIVPTGGKQLNAFDVAAASQLGAFSLYHRKGLAGPNRGVTLYETGNMSNAARAAFARGDQSVVDFFSSDIIRILEQLIQQGKVGGYRPQQSSLSAPTPRSVNVAYSLPYRNNSAGMVMINQGDNIIASVSGNQASNAAPVSVGGGGGGSNVVVIAQAGINRNQLLETKLALA